MKQSKKALPVTFALFSAISSFLLVFYAVNVAFSPGASTGVKAFAYVAGGYGLMNIYILSWAWRTHVRWAIHADLVIAACFFGVCVMDFLRSGATRGTAGAAVLLVVAITLSINWYAIKLVTKRD